MPACFLPPFFTFLCVILHALYNSTRAHFTCPCYPECRESMKKEGINRHESQGAGHALGLRGDSGVLYRGRRADLHFSVSELPDPIY